MADFDPEISSGEIVAEAQLARDDGAPTQNPVDSVTTVSTNTVDTQGLTLPLSAEQAAYFVDQNQRLRSAGIISADAGLNASNIPLSQSQATPPNDINAVAKGKINISAPTKPGTGARNDDAKTVTGNSTKDIINATFLTSTNRRIITQQNVLDDYASYTYQISWYMLTPAQYNAVRRSIRPNTAGWNLLVQSGGAPLTSPTDQPGRSPWFPDDFYLDDLEIHSRTPGKGVGMPHNAIAIKFKVVEPNGLTLVDRLYNAVYAAYGANAGRDAFDPNGYDSAGPPTAYTPNAGQQQTQTQINQKNNPGIPNYSKAAYCLGIKFYGYDNEGNLVAPAKGKNVYTPASDLGKSQVGPFSIGSEIIHKLFVFNMTELKFRMAAGANSKGVEYSIAGVPIPMNTAFGQARGTVPFQFELTGTTVKDILVGNRAAASLPARRQEGRVPQSTPPGNNIPPTDAALNAAGYNGPDGESVGS
jgi:hypothetical protein